MKLFRPFVLVALLFACGGSAFAEPRLSIEAAQRALQERHSKFVAWVRENDIPVTGISLPDKLTFPPRRSDGALPGEYPPDCFYDDDIIDPATGRVRMNVLEDLVMDLVLHLNDFQYDYFLQPAAANLDQVVYAGDFYDEFVPEDRMVQAPVLTWSNHVTDFRIIVAKIDELRHPWLRIVPSSDDGTGAPLQRDGSTFGDARTTCSGMKTATLLNWEAPINHVSFPGAPLGRAELILRSTSNSIDYYSGYFRSVTGRHVMAVATYGTGTYRVFDRQMDLARQIWLYASGGLPWDDSNVSLAGTDAPLPSYNRFHQAHGASISATPYEGPIIADYSSPSFTAPCPSTTGTTRFGWAIEKVIVLTPRYEHNVTAWFVDCGNCATSCSSSTCTLGKKKVGLGSLKMEVGLGRDSEESVGHLRHYVREQHHNIAHPANLTWALNKSAEVVYEPSAIGTLRQIKSPQGLVDVVANNTNFRSYELRFYESGNIGTRGSNGVYAVSGTPYKTVTVANPDSALWTRTVSGVTAVTFDFATYYLLLDVPNHGLPLNGAYAARLASSTGILPTTENGPLKATEEYAVYPYNNRYLYVLSRPAGSTTFDVVEKSGTHDPTATLTLQSTFPKNRVRITESGGAHTKEDLYTFNAVGPVYSWSLERNVNNTLLMTETKTRTYTVSGGGEFFTDVETKWNDSSHVVSRKATTKQIFSWNRKNADLDALQGEVLSETLDPDGAALTTTYAYYTDAANDGVNYKRLKERIGPDGSWERYQYDASGRTTRIYRSYLNGAPSWSYSGNEVVDYTYDLPVALPDSLTGTMTQIVTKQDDQEVSRSYSITSEDTANALRLSISIRAKNTGAAWDDASNLVTKTWSHIGGSLDGRTVRVLNPDGTASLYAYSLNTTTGEETITTWSGVPDSTLSTITRGTKTVTVTNAKGGQASTDTYDIATAGETLVASAIGIDFDEFGRPREIHFLDGTSHHYNYGCCGLLSETDRQGVTTTYTRDEEERPLTATRAGVTTETVYDVLGRARLMKRYPAGQPGSSIAVSETEYDVAGRVSFARSYGRQTGYVETPQLAQRKTTRETTMPFNAAWSAAERGNLTEVTWADGRTERETGTAAAARRYTYGTATLSEASDLGYAGSTRFQTVTEILLDDAGADTAETVTRYIDPLGRTVKVLYAGGASSLQAYNNAGQLTWQKDPDGVLTRFEYNDLGERHVTVLDMDRLPSWSYASNDRITRTTREVTTRTDGSTATPVQRVKTEVWLTDNQDTPRELSVTDVSLDGLTSWQTTNGLTTKSVTAYNVATQTRTETTTFPDKTSMVRVSVNERLQSETRRDNTNATVTSSTYGYDAHGRPETVTDSLGRVTTSAYHPGKDEIHTLTTPDPDTSRSGSGYDAQTTTYLYDEAGRVRSVEQHDGAITETTYWGNGKAKRISGGRTYPQAYTYDAQGRLKTLTTWQDYAGQTGAAVTTWHYHAERGWLESKEYNDGKGPSFDYWPSGRLKTRDWARIVAGGSTRLRSSYGYNNAGELETITYNDDQTPHPTPAVTHTYDRGGRLHTTTDAAGLLTRSYDPTSLRLSSEAYSGTGELSGRSIARSYDYLHRPQGLTTDGGYGLGYGYDKAGRLETLSQGFHSATFGYQTGTSLHNRTTVKRVNVERVRHDRTLDRINRIERVTSTVAGAQAVYRDYTYNDANQRVGVEHEDTRRWAYGYDGLGQVTSAQKRLADNTTPLPGYSFGFTFDDIGNRTQTIANDRPATYAPDLLNRYSSRVVPGAFDVRGEAHADATVTVDTLATTRTGKDFYRELAGSNSSTAVSQDLEIEASRTSPAESADETRAAFLPQTPESFDHDDDGNLKQDGRWDYHWDAENRLVGMETRASIASAFPDQKKRLTFVYDSQGRRIRKTVENWDALLNSGAGDWVETISLIFLYDGWNLLTELDGNDGNALVRSHAWGLDLSGSIQGAGGVGGLLWSSTPTHTFAVCHDGNGNGTAWINTGTLAVSGRVDYGAFGEVVQATGVAKTLPFGFSTKYLDEETGLLYYGFRYYNPSTGRWPNRDPIEERGGLNLYAMVGNSPVNRTDYLGLYCKTTIFFGHTGEGASVANAEFVKLAKESVVKGLDGSTNQSACDAYGFVGCFPDSVNESIPSSYRLLPAGSLDPYLESHRSAPDSSAKEYLYPDKIGRAYQDALRRAVAKAKESCDKCLCNNGRSGLDGNPSDGVYTIIARCSPDARRALGDTLCGGAGVKTMSISCSKLKNVTLPVSDEFLRTLVR